MPKTRVWTRCDNVLGAFAYAVENGHRSANVSGLNASGKHDELIYTHAVMCIAISTSKVLLRSMYASANWV